MTDPLLALTRAETDRLYQAAILARARAYEAQADAELAMAAYCVALGHRDAAAQATERAAGLREEAHLTLDMTDDRRRHDD